MKRLLTIALAATLLAACKQTGSDTTMIWIEDKPGPSVQGTNIFPTVPDSLWQALGLTEGVPSSMSCFLMQTEGEYILFDAGLGAPFSQLLPRLSELGLSPADIPYIYITHMHGDHIGGLISDGASVFPNAQLYVNRLEAEAWLSMPDGRGAQAQAMLEAYSGRVHLFEGGDVLPLGVKSIAAYGHTPGHTCFEKDSILVIADILHGAALQLEHPEYCPFFDMDPAAAIESRLRILAYAREHGLSMYGHHLPSPGYIICAETNRPVVTIETSMGEIVVELFNETPLHRDNFLRLVDEHVYDSLLFHRVISGFMIQAGDTQSKNAPSGVLLGDSDLPYQVPAEIRVDQGLVHHRGVLAAAREGDDTNPERASSSTQFYITQADVPRLDGKYTIFGRVIRGMDVVDAIADVATDHNDRPLEDIRILSTSYMWSCPLPNYRPCSLGEHSKEHQREE